MSAVHLAAPQRWTSDQPVTQLTLDLYNADVTVVGTDGPARLEVTRIGQRPVDLTHHDGILRLHQPKPGFLGRAPQRDRVELSIAVPRSVVCNLSVAVGELTASGLRDAVTITVAKGNVSLLGLAGTVRAETISGEIEALGVAGDTTLQTVSGPITVGGVTAARLTVKAISGALTCDLDNPRGGDIDLHTVSGAITVRVREDSDLDVNLSTVSGGVATDFAGLATSGVTGGPKELRGRLGAGIGRLKADAVSGAISLLARPLDADEITVGGTR